MSRRPFARHRRLSRPRSIAHGATAIDSSSLRKAHGRASAERARRVGRGIVLLPLFLVFAAFLAYQELSGGVGLIPSWIVVALIVVLVALKGIQFLVRQRLEYGAGPNILPVAAEPAPEGRHADDLLLLTGEVFHRGEAGGDQMLWRAADLGARWIDVDISAAESLSADGATRRAPGVPGCVRLTVNRELFKAIRPRQHVKVLCTPGARVIDLVDADAAP
jgi:hypothetical protein